MKGAVTLKATAVTTHHYPHTLRQGEKRNRERRQQRREKLDKGHTRPDEVEGNFSLSPYGTHVPLHEGDRADRVKLAAFVSCIIIN